MRLQHKVLVLMKRNSDFGYFNDMLKIAFQERAPSNLFRSTRGSIDHITVFENDEDVIAWTTWLVRNGYSYSYEFTD